MTQPYKPHPTPKNPQNLPKNPLLLAQQSSRDKIQWSWLIIMKNGSSFLHRNTPTNTNTITFHTRTSSTWIVVLILLEKPYPIHRKKRLWLELTKFKRAIISRNSYSLHWTEHTKFTDTQRHRIDCKTVSGTGPFKAWLGINAASRWI